MSKAITAENLGWFHDTRIQEEILEVDTCPRNKAFFSVLAKSFLHISQVIQIKRTDFDYKKEALSVVNVTERIKMRCLCGENLSRKYRFCPTCGNKVVQALLETTEQRHERLIPIDIDTLGLIERYLDWRGHFPYQGELLFPFSRQRAWQIVEKLGRRAGLKGLHPSSLRHLLAARWVNKGLDIKMLRFLMGYAGMITHPPLFSFEQIKAEYLKLWEP